MITSTKIEGKSYFTIKEFAALTNRGRDSVWSLMLKGNRLRKLHYKRFFGKPFICADELTEFPFTVRGRSLDIYHYDKNGKVTG